jgi:hypothetical protein
MYSKNNFSLNKVNFKKFTKIVLGKVIEKKKIFSVLNYKDKQKDIFKVLLSDSSGCINIFSSAFATVKIGEIIKVSKLKIFFHRNSFKVIGFFYKSVNLFNLNDSFSFNFEKNYSKKKYKIFLL